MATSVATITTGTMSAAVIKARQSSVKAWINGGMVVGDLQTDSWAGPEYVFGPEFFGTPAPMARMTFGDVHWRSRSQDRSKGHHQHPEFRTVDGSNWIPIDGLQATVGIDQASDVKLTACYYVFVRGDGGSSVSGWLLRGVWGHPELTGQLTAVCLWVRRNNIGKYQQPDLLKVHSPNVVFREP